MTRLPHAPGDSPTFSPLYRQIKALLTRALSEGEWRPGEAIPSETGLAARYGVSQGTVRKAIEELAAENLLVRRQGRGTFVATHTEDRAQFRFLRLRADDGQAPRTMASRILAFKRSRAPAEVVRALRLRGGERAFRISRLLVFAGHPTELDEIWLPGGRFRGLTQERLSAHQGPLYALFEADFATRVVRAAESVRAVAAGRREAAELGVAPGAPVLLVERTTYTYQDQPVELRRGVCRTDRYHYSSDLS